MDRKDYLNRWVVDEETGDIKIDDITQLISQKEKDPHQLGIYFFGGESLIGKFEKAFLEEKLKNYYKDLTKGLIGKYPKYLQKLEQLTKYSFGEFIVGELFDLRYDLEEQKDKIEQLRKQIKVSMSIASPHFILPICAIFGGFILVLASIITNVAPYAFGGMICIIVAILHLLALKIVK